MIVRVAFIKLMKRFTLLTCLIFSIPFLDGCKFKEHVRFTDQEVTTQWADMALFITRNTPANSPTYASRALGYIGVTMYESVIFGFDKSKSLGNQLNGLGAMPTP